MKCCTSLLIVVLIGLVAADGGWNRNQEYNYKVITKALTASHDEKWNGSIFQARLSLRPESEDIFIGQLGRPQYAKVQTSRRWDLDVSYGDLQYNDLPLEQPFKIKLKNGVIESLFVDRKLTEHQINQLKFVINGVMNQFQVDTNAQNRMNGDNGFYTKNEQTVVGECETVYEISPLPEYLAQSSRDLVPFPELQRQRQFLDVIKTRNYNNCNKQTNTRSNLMKNPLSGTSLSEVNRIILSGSLNDYTIQSSVSTIKEADNLYAPPKTISYINVTLESIESNTNNSPDLDNLMNVENKVNYNDYNNSQKNSVQVSTLGDDDGDKDGERRMSGCWSWFPSPNSICHGDFGPEWVGLYTENCGFLGLGHRAMCQRQYPGCESTACYSFFVQNLCDDFGGRLPVHKGGYENCSPGFWRWRCCPK